MTIFYMLNIIKCLCVFLLSYLLTGCTSTPRWASSSLDNTYYHTGIGSGLDYNAAEVNALLDLSAQIHGTEIEAVIEYFRREYGEASTSHVDEDFRQHIKQYTAGKIPAEVRIVERWEGNGAQWAYAVVERQGQIRQINRLFQKHMAGIRGKSLVPGWAQFQKRQPRKAWTYMAGVAIGIVGGVTFATLSNDARDRRDRSTLQVDHTYYDDLANQRFWASAGFYLLAATTYTVNVLDGWYTTIQPYQILTNLSTPGVRGIQVSVAF